MSNQKIIEDRARRRARRLGLRITKYRNGFMVVDADTNGVVAGSQPFPYALNLDDVNEVLVTYARID
ncbi:hypothetical protein [Amycolatopsis sp. NPDC051128]|uniref:hypothetical protein n=1 Tax=Amycolatopsis sp. NPDC051128 TaxID=3155412 RepID=UPI00342F0601